MNLLGGDVVIVSCGGRSWCNRYARFNCLNRESCGGDSAAVSTRCTFREGVQQSFLQTSRSPVNRCPPLNGPVETNKKRISLTCNARLIALTWSYFALVSFSFSPKTLSWRSSTPLSEWIDWSCTAARGLVSIQVSPISTPPTPLRTFCLQSFSSSAIRALMASSSVKLEPLPLLLTAVPSGALRRRPSFSTPGSD